MATMMDQFPIHAQAVSADHQDEALKAETATTTSTTTTTTSESFSSDTATISTSTESATARTLSSGDDNDNSNTHGTHGQVRVISFDLDNTLWETMPTIGAALQAVATFLELHGIPPAGSDGAGRTTETVMKELWQADKATYAPLLQDQATCPALLTKLRQDALQHLLIHDHGYTVADATALAAQAFAVMSDARHAAIPHHLAAGVVESLMELRRRLQCHHNTNASPTPVLMGAITDGNAHPGRVAALRPFFDFCIQAEAVGVGKPDVRIFQQAVVQVWPHMGVNNTTTVDNENNNNLHEWVHIGDDLRKDVVGAKAMGMRTIWCREFIQDKLRNTTTALTKDLSSWNTTTTTTTTTTCPGGETRKRMDPSDSSGSTHEEDEACADAIVDRFADIVDVLETWHQQGQQQQQ